MASNMLIGTPIRLQIGVLAERTRNLALQFPPAPPLIFDGLIGRQAGETDTLAGKFHAFLIGNGGGHGGRRGWLGR